MVILSINKKFFFRLSSIEKEFLTINVENYFFFIFLNYMIAIVINCEVDNACVCVCVSYINYLYKLITTPRCYFEVINRFFLCINNIINKIHKISITINYQRLIYTYT